MQAQVLASFDGPDGLSLRAVDPPPLGEPTDVRIRIAACGVCHRDITWARGLFGGGSLPAVLGHEGAGTVLEVAAGVTDLERGDRVVHLQFPFCGSCEHCAAGRPQLCTAVRGAVGEVRQGAYAEELVLPRHLLLPIPEDLGMPEASVCACTLGTAYHALRLYGFDPAGRTVALNGAGGGVGLHSIQVAKALGAEVIAVTSSPAKEEAIRAAGADTVVVAPNGRYRLAMARATARRGVDLFLEIVGAPTLQESVLSTGPAGRVVVTGNPQGGTCAFNPALLILRGELRMYGTLAVTPDELAAVFGLVAAGRIAPVIDTVAPLADLPNQWRRMEAREPTGRVVVTP